MDNKRDKIEQTEVQELSKKEMESVTGSGRVDVQDVMITFGGAKPGVYEDWLALCDKYPDSAPCKGRH